MRSKCYIWLVIIVVTVSWRRRRRSSSSTTDNVVVDGFTFPSSRFHAARTVARHIPRTCGDNIANHHDRPRRFRSSDDVDAVCSALIPLSSSRSSVDTNEQGDAEVPEFHDILDNLVDSSQRIVRTMSLIVSKQLATAKGDDMTHVREIVQEILQLCDEYDQIMERENTSVTSDISSTNFMELIRNFNSEMLQLYMRQFLFQSSISVQKKSMRYQRYESLVRLMQMNYTSYITTATFLCSNDGHNMKRYELPNVQDVPYTVTVSSSSNSKVPQVTDDAVDDTLVPDCTLNTMEYNESLLDQLLLYIFRRLVTKHTGGITSSQKGINGLLEQGRTFMIQQQSDQVAQHAMVQNTLRDLMTPILPPFYRIFMSGIIPKIQLQNVTVHPMEQQYGPWFYAPYLTSYITPIFFAFLVGPSYPNRRIDGTYGGLLVEKCKFLQESNCKGLCLHQCKLPAQNFFNATLGLSLNVVPNFVTQECQWNFNEMPITPVDDDPSFPKGCISGCTSRKNLLASSTTTTPSNVKFCN